MPEKRASKPSTGEACDKIERLALRDAFGNVEHDDVAKLFQTDKKRQRAADLTRAYQCDLASRHLTNVLDW